ncbi:MAG: cysteine--tRNA ligase [Candidatus Aenigmarchaeota archaeon]|nr:cysteine--tRNA ligase [Candidatus Aenigmarchaeota archaeon]
MKNSPIKLFNTAARAKQAFKPLKPGHVGMYNCGPTVYDYAHLGHFRAYTFVDTLKRVLAASGYKLKTVMNITDVGHLTSDADTGEDKMEKAAAEKRMTAWDLAAFYTTDFFDAMDKLNIARPDIVCKATEHIPQMIELIKKLEKKGYTYRTSDGIYYDTYKFKDYAKFAQLNLKQLQEGARVEPNPEKRNPPDFALWKFSPKDSKRQMEWESPWGTGFPGWHIECSAMDMQYLGDRFDIHTGGIDHIPIHHTNEIAQSDAAVGHKVVQYWMHNEFVMVEGSKMSKSRKNFYTMADIEARGVDPLALRYLFLTAHYRSKMNFTWGSLSDAERALSTLRERTMEFKADKKKPQRGDVKKAAAYEKEFMLAVNNDLNTPIALAIMWAAVRDADLAGSAKYELLMKFDDVLGLRLKDVKPARKETLSDEVGKLVKMREQFRKDGKYAEADEVRKRLDSEFGIVIEDTVKGTKWKKK